MKLDMLIEEEKRLHRQEKFAQENFAGLDQMGKELMDARKKVKQMWVKARKLKKNKDRYYEELKKIEDYSDELSNIILVMSIKMTTSFAHALNGNSTNTLKEIIRFMDKYGISDKIFTHNNMRTIAQTRSVHSDNILTLSAIIAAKIDDIEFVKDLETFAEKNKGRENMYGDFAYSVSQYGDFNLNMAELSEKRRIAFEALVNGSEKIYKYLAGDDGLSSDYIIKYIKNKEGFWKRERLKETEVSNVLKIEPKFIDDVLKYMPENLPSYINDIFFF